MPHRHRRVRLLGGQGRVATAAVGGIEPLGQPSKWVTLGACSVLGAADG